MGSFERMFAKTSKDRASKYLEPRRRLARFEKCRRDAERARLPRLLVDNAAEAMLYVDSDARILYANRHACQRLEYSRHEMIGRFIHDFDPDYPKHLWPHHWEDIRRIKKLVVETNHKTRTGRMIPVEVTISYFMHGDKERCTSVIRDITERKRTDEALRRNQAEIVALSAPILQVAKGVVALPIIGELDARRATQVMEALLEECVRAGAQFAILDLTGAKTIDSATAEHLMRIGQAVRLLGGSCALSGISPSTARTIIELGVEMKAFLTFATLRDALKHAMKMVDLRPQVRRGTTI
jgi:anti-anti-sigma factor